MMKVLTYFILISLVLANQILESDILEYTRNYP